MRALAILLLALLTVLLPPAAPTSADHLSPLDCALAIFAGHPHCAGGGTGDFPDDGRIGDWGGDYIVYCKNGFLEVWRLKEGTNQGELVAKFPLGDIRPGDGNSIHDSGSGVTVTRFADKVSVSGYSNWNNRLGFNVRSIDAKDCEGLKSAARLALEELAVRKSDLVDAAEQLIKARDDASITPELLAELWVSLYQQASDLAADFSRFALNNPDLPEARDQAIAAGDLKNNVFALSIRG